MAEEEKIRAKYIGMVINLKELCPTNYKNLTEQDYQLYFKYLELKEMER